MEVASMSRDGDEESVSEPSRTDDILAKLMRKAKRRRQKAQGNDNGDEAEPTEGSGDAEKAERRQRRKLALTNDHLASSEKRKRKSKSEESDVSGGVSKRKRKLVAEEETKVCGQRDNNVRTIRCEEKIKSWLEKLAARKVAKKMAVKTSQSAVELPKKKRKNLRKKAAISSASGVVEKLTNGVGKVGETAKRKKKKKKPDEATIMSNGTSGNNLDEKLVNGVDEVIEVASLTKRRKQQKSIEVPSEAIDITENTEFTVIGQQMSLKPQEVTAFLPAWLRDPTTFSTNLHEDLTDLCQIPGLHPNIVTTLEASGMRQLFPVQACVIPWLLRATLPGAVRPNDICVSAPTGSGKTLAFVLPIVQALRSRVVRSIRALVVLPVHELAVQVFEVFKMFCANNNLNVGLAAGVISFAKEQSSIVKRGFRGYQSLVDILVCTPGRLVDHINMTEGFTLKDLRFLVIDEADRMVDQIKHGWLNKVEQVSPGSIAGSATPITPSSVAELQRIPQKLLFSATLSHDVEKLEAIKLFQPILFSSRSKKGRAGTSSVIDVSPTDGGISRLSVPDELTQLGVVCEPELKPLIMLHLLHHLKYRHVLCFTNSLVANNRLFKVLSNFGGLSVVEISSNESNHHRRRKLDQFKAGLIDVIVCTDAMARGIDVENVEYVISYDMPLYAITYVHRVGRTARAGRGGTTVTLLKSSEERKFTKMLKDVGIQGVSPFVVQQSALEPLVDQYQTTLGHVKDAIKVEIVRKIRRTK